MTSATTLTVVQHPETNKVSDSASQISLDHSIASLQKALDKIAKHGKNSSAIGESIHTASCLITLCKVIDNILLERQYNPKTRSIKLGNRLFRDRVGSVPGGVEVLLCCNFKYVRIASRTPVRKNSNGSIPGNAIKLLKENESRELLVLARRYLQEYGARVMKIKPGKHRNELPPYVIHDDIPDDTLQRIEENVDGVIKRDEGRIENLGSVMEQNSSTSDFSSASSVMTPTSQTYDMSESAPPSPHTICTNEYDEDDEMSLSSGVSNGTRNTARNDSSDRQSANSNQPSTGYGEIGSEKTPEKMKSGLDIPAEISPLAKQSPTNYNVDIQMPLTLSPMKSKQSMDDDSSPNSVIDSNTNLHIEEKKDMVEQSLEERFKVFDMDDANNISKSLSSSGDDQSLGSEAKPAVSLTDEEIDAIQDITKFDGFNGTEDEQVLSIATGNLLNTSKEEGSLFKKLNKLACNKKKKKGEKDEVTCDQKTTMTACSSSHIRIKNNDSLTIGSSKGLKNKSDLIVSKEKPGQKKMAMGKVEKHLSNSLPTIEVGLRLFFAIFVVVYNFEDGINADEQSNGTNDGGDNRSPIPVEILYKLWTALLRSERSFCKMDGREIYQSFLDVSTSNSRNISTADKALLASLEANDIGACKYIVHTLRDAALVCISDISLDRNPQSSFGGRNSQKRMGMKIYCAESVSYGLQIARNSLQILYDRLDGIISLKQGTCKDGNREVEKLRQKCHSIISRSLLENIDFDGADKIFIDQNVDFDLLGTWYIIRWLPYHLLSAHMYDEALKLLVDIRYLQARFESTGLYEGTIKYITDCRIIQSYSTKDDAQSAMSTEDFSVRVVLAVYDAVHSFLNSTKKRYSLNFEVPKKEKLIDLANALHHLAIAIGEVEGDRRAEIDILNEALRFRVAGNDDKLMVAETQLQLGSCFHAISDPTKAITSYGEALQLTMDVHGSQYEGLSKILYHMGVLYCEQDQCDPALECFVRALTILQNQVDPSESSEDVAKIYSWIGNVHRENGNSSMALSYFQKALQTSKTLIEPDQLEIAEILQNIGIVFDDLKDDEESLRALYECLNIRRKFLCDEFHHDICETIGCIANVYRRSDIDMSLKLFRIVLNARAKDTERMDTDDEDLIRCHVNFLEVAKIKLQKSSAGDDNDLHIDDELHIEIATLYFRIGSLLEKCGRYTHAIENYLKSLKIRKVKKQYHDIGDLLNSLGIAHAKRQSFKKALKCFTDSLKVRRTVLGPHHADVGETLHNMGNCSAKQNDYDSAAEYYEKSLIIKRLALGNESVSTANTLHKIGMVNEELGLLLDSLAYYKDALSIRTVLLGKRHIEVAFSLHSIGAIYQQTGSTDKAIECLKTSLRLKRNHYIGGHLSIAETMNLLATGYTTVRQAEDAIPLFEETLVIFEKRFGAHMTTAGVLDSLGAVYLSKGKLGLSHSYFERALVVKRLIYGDDDYEVSNTLFQIGKVQSKSGDFNDALETFKEVLRLRKQIFGNDSTEVAAIINDVGVIQLRRGENDVARNCFLEAQRVWKSKGEDNLEHLGETLVNLGEIYHLEKKYCDAITNFNEALSIFESVHDNTHLSIALAQYKLGKSLKEQHEYDMAMTSFERSLSIRLNKLGNNNMLVAEVLKDLGALCLILGDLSKARDYLSEALSTVKSKNPNGLVTSETFYLLGKVMMKMKYKDEAFEAFSTALKIKRRRLNEDDLETADMLLEMGQIHEYRNQWQRSLELYAQALKVRENLLGIHELVGDCHFSIGAVHKTIRKHRKALTNYGSALVIYQKALGDDHITCAKTMNNIGIVYEAIEEYEEALKYHKEGLRIRKLKLGKDHIKIANSLDNIAGIYQRQQESDKALQSLKESLKIRSRFGTDNLDVATTLFGMGIIYVDQGDSLKALECYESALEIRKRKGKEFEVAQTLHNIGSLWAMRQDYKKALKHWQNALQIYRQTLDEDDHMIACTLGNIKMAENMLEEEINF